MPSARSRRLARLPVRFHRTVKVRASGTATTGCPTCKNNSSNRAASGVSSAAARRVSSSAALSLLTSSLLGVVASTSASPPGPRSSSLVASLALLSPLVWAGGALIPATSPSAVVAAVAVVLLEAGTPKTDRSPLLLWPLLWWRWSNLPPRRGASRSFTPSGSRPPWYTSSTRRVKANSIFSRVKYTSGPPTAGVTKPNPLLWRNNALRPS
ncbi:hypothetical protein DQ04_19001000 [Trypanosoma grayi]|uniref:hypothetical protein n=1 Tax=Trypanosoma grayi TaxID=71804 RepID=UPI0004F4B3E9|nr:hypothetical protein DQ04_19001000 [Trypanosoma grayi]KEG05718.1 hypothetical protein DQ04_19001000 [Trypanosoma grayi]